METNTEANFFKKNFKYILALLFVIFIGVGIFIFNKKKGTASIACPTLSTFKSEYGVFNINGYGLGSVLIIEHDNNTVKGILQIDTIAINPKDIEVKYRGDIKTNANLSFAVNATAGIPQEILVQLQQELKNRTVLYLKNSNIYRIKNPSAYEYGKAIKLKKNQYLAIISQVIRADSLSFGMKNDLAAGAKTKMVIGNYQIALKYMCENFISSGGEKAQDAFFTYNIANFKDTISIARSLSGKIKNHPKQFYNGMYVGEIDTISVSQNSVKLALRYTLPQLLQDAIPIDDSAKGREPQTLSIKDTIAPIIMNWDSLQGE